MKIGPSEVLVLRGSASTTEAVRRAIQHSQESLRVLTRRYGINQKTVAKWKNRTSAADLPTGPKKPKKKFKAYPIGFFDIAAVQTAEDKLRVFVGIDWTSKFAYTELHQEARKMVAARFLRNLIAAVPYTIHTVLTDNGIRFTNPAGHKYAFYNIFDRACDGTAIDRRLTKINHP